MTKAEAIQEAIEQAQEYKKPHFVILDEGQFAVGSLFDLECWDIIDDDILFVAEYPKQASAGQDIDHAKK